MWPGDELARVRVSPADAWIQSIEVGGSEFGDFFKGAITWTFAQPHILISASQALALVCSPLPAAAETGMRRRWAGLQPTYPFPRSQVSLPIMVTCNGVTYKLGVLFIRGGNEYAPVFLNQPYVLSVDEVRPHMGAPICNGRQCF